MSNRRILLYIILIVVFTISVYTVFVVVPNRLAKQSYDGVKAIANDLKEALQFTPEVRVNNTVVFGQENPIFELALISHRFRHQYTWQESWMGSTKNIEVTGSFEAKAGFDLNERFVIDIGDKTAMVRLPRAQLLSLTPQNDLVFKDENGVWNWVKDEERSRAINAFSKNARAYAENAPLSNKAEQELEKRIREIMRSHGKEVRFEYSETLKRN